MSEYGDIKEQIGDEMVQEEYNLQDTKVTHVENLFIISYLTKALQDFLIRKSRFFQYPLLLIDLPLAMAILIVNVERILYVKLLGYVLAHIQYDVSVLKSLIFSRGGGEENPENMAEMAFDMVRKFFRFLWGFIILLFILPVWPLIWIYNYIVQTLLIALIYYFLLFYEYSFAGGFLIYYLLLVTVTFLVSSITVPFIFRLGVYVRALFSLERKTWRKVNIEAKMAFIQFYKRLHGKHSKAMAEIKPRYAELPRAEGGVYYMLLKFLHYLKDKFWQLKERKIEVVVEKIQDKTVELVDEYYQEKYAYYFTLKSLTPKDLKRTVVALIVTIVFSVMLVLEGSGGKGLIGPILLSFVEQPVSEQIWVAHAADRGYYQDMVHSYSILPNFLQYVAIAFDGFFNLFFQAYYASYPIYLDFLARYYSLYLNVFLSGVLGPEG